MPVHERVGRVVDHTLLRHGEAVTTRDKNGLGPVSDLYKIQAV